LECHLTRSARWLPLLDAYEFPVEWIQTDSLCKLR
jgi:hypothetical protein